MEPTVLAASGAAVIAAALGFVYLVRHTDQRSWLVVPLVLGTLGVLLLRFDPPARAQFKGEALQDLNEKCQFLTVYNRAKDLYGEIIGSITVRDGVPQVWTSFARLECHQENAPGWWMENGNLGLEYATAKGIEIDPAPEIPVVVSNYLAAQQARGVDTLRYYGMARTSPWWDNGRFYMLWDKALLSWPANTSLQSANDPGAVAREPLGVVLMPGPGGGALTDPWTETRKTLGIGAAVSMLVMVVLMIWAARGGYAGGYGD